MNKIRRLAVQLCWCSRDAIRHLGLTRVPLIQLKSLPSRVEAISPFADGLMQYILQFREPDGSEVDIEIALRETLTNAVVHGNQADPGKRVGVVWRVTPDGEIWIIVCDQGTGFDTEAVPDPTAPENQLATHGRGIYLMHALMDDVWFDEGGTVVYLHKYSNSGSNGQQRRSQ